MQKRLFVLMSTAIFAMLIFSSCNKNNTQGRYIPANAGAVIHIDGASLGKKLSWNDVKQNSAFKMMSADSSVPAFAKAVLNDPDNSGVDVSKDIIAFYVDDSTGKYAAVEGSIKDAAKFKAFMANADTAGTESSKDGITYWSGKGTSVGYNKDRFVFTADPAGYMPAQPNINWADTSSMTDSIAPIINDIPSVAPVDMNSKTAMLFNLKEDGSLSKNERFSELMEMKGDLHFWVNYEHFSAMSNMGAMGGAAAMMNVEKLYKGMVNMAAISFDDGKIVMDSKTYGGKEINELYKKYGGTNVDKAVLQNIPSSEVAGVFAFNFKPEGVRELLKLLNMEGFANIGAGQLGFTLDDFVKANKGELLISVGDLRKDSTKGQKATFLFAAGINDKASFSKLVEAGRKGGAAMNAMGENFGYLSNDRWFALSNEKTMADAFIAGKGNNKAELFNKITGSPMGGYVNLQYIIKAMAAGDTPDSSAKAMLDANLKMWDNVILKGGEYKNGGVVGRFELNLVDQKMNSLKQLNNFISSMAAMRDAKVKETEARDNAIVDTITVTP